jgi:hypothetical protein
MRNCQGIIRLGRSGNAVDRANGDKAVKVASAVVFAFEIMKYGFPIVLRIYTESFDIPTRFAGDNQFG